MYTLSLALSLGALAAARSEYGKKIEAEVAGKSQRLARWEAADLVGVQKLYGRQDASTPPYTDDPICDDQDGYFYVTNPGNMTFQLQCTTTYNGVQDNFSPADSLFGCIDYCASLNMASRGSCVGVNWNAPFVGSGECSTFSEVFETLPAFEGGGYQEAALLIYGPDGTVYATPRPFTASSTTAAPTPAETQNSVPGTQASPTSSSGSLSPLIPLPSSRISTSTSFTLDRTSVSPAAGGTASVSIPSGLVGRTLRGTTSTTTTPIVYVFPTSPRGTCSTTSTTTTTSTITITACPPAVSCGSVQGSSSTRFTALPNTTSSPDADNSPPLTEYPTFTTSPIEQVTITQEIPITTFEIQPVVVCDNSGGCSPSARIDTVVSLRTGLRCAPGACSGSMVNTLVDALFSAPTCVLVP